MLFLRRSQLLLHSLHTVQVFGGAILQQTVVVEFVVNGQMCDDCRRREAKDFWRAVVQVRQKVCVWVCTLSQSGEKGRKLQAPTLS